MIHFLEQSWIQALGWTLLHAIWQASLLAIIWLIAKYFLKNASAHLRYLAAISTLLALLACSTITFWKVYPNQIEISSPVISLESFTLSHLDVSIAPSSVTIQEVKNIQWKGLLNDIAPWLSLLWILGASLMGLRFTHGVFYLHKLRNTGLQEIESSWQIRSASIAHKMGLNANWLIKESSLVSEPLTLGHFKPLILIPMGMLSGLNPNQVEAIIAHEFAHIYRVDFLFNLIQSLIEILFFFHPAVWWLSKEIRRERELCCDDLAVATLGDAFAYAEALTHLQAFCHTPKHFLTMQASGNKGSFTARIQRLFQTKTVQSPWRSISASILLVLILTGSVYYGYTQKALYETDKSSQDILAGNYHSESIEEVEKSSIKTTQEEAILLSEEDTTQELINLIEKENESDEELENLTGIEEDDVEMEKPRSPERDAQAILLPLSERAYVSLDNQENLPALRTEPLLENEEEFIPITEKQLIPGTEEEKELLAEYFIEPHTSQEEIDRIGKEIFEYDRQKILQAHRNVQGLIEEVFFWGTYSTPKNSQFKSYKTGLRNFSKAHIQVSKTPKGKPMISLKDPIGDAYWTDELEQVTLSLKVGGTPDKLTNWVKEQNKRGAQITVEELNTDPETGELLSYRLDKRAKKPTTLPAAETILYSGRDHILMRMSRSAPKVIKSDSDEKPKEFTEFPAKWLNEIASPPSLVYLDGKFIGNFENSNGLRKQLLEKGLFSSNEDIGRESFYSIQNGDISQLLVEENLSSLPAEMEELPKQFNVTVLKSWEYLAAAFDKEGEKKHRLYLFEGESQGFKKGIIPEVVREICKKKDIGSSHVVSNVLSEEEAQRKYQVKAIEVVEILITDLDEG